MSLFVLYEKKKSRGFYISYDPVREVYRRAASVKALKIWDVWGADLLPYILEEKGVKGRFQAKQLPSFLAERLPFTLD